MPCLLPPPGWYCTRERGHDGPCAAWPEHTDAIFVTGAHIACFFVGILVGIMLALA